MAPLRLLASGEPLYSKLKLVVLDEVRLCVRLCVLIVNEKETHKLPKHGIYNAVIDETLIVHEIY